MPLDDLNYTQASETPQARHNRIYTSLLIALAIFYLIGSVSIWSISRKAATQPDADWLFPVIAGTYVVFVAAMITTVVLRFKAPVVARVVTMALNVVLLVLFPFGTALGIYGLLKVDKQRSLAEA